MDENVKDAYSKKDFERKQRRGREKKMMESKKWRKKRVCVILSGFSKLADKLEAKHEMSLWPEWEWPLYPHQFLAINNFFYNKFHVLLTSHYKRKISLMKKLQIKCSNRDYWYKLSHLLNIYEQKLLPDWLIQHHVTCHTIKDFPVEGEISSN